MTRSLDETADPRDAVRSPRFWLIALCVGVVAGGVAGCIPNRVKILVSHGQPRATAVWTVGFVGLFAVAGRALCGAPLDRLRPQAVACAFLATPALACLLLVHGPPGFWTGAGAAGLVGPAAGAEFDVLAFLIAGQFGLRRYGSIYGAASMVFAFCSGAAPMVFAAAFDRTGSYDGVLTWTAIVFLVGEGACCCCRTPAAGPPDTPFKSVVEHIANRNERCTDGRVDGRHPGLIPIRGATPRIVAERGSLQ